ncbi:hypothetical protein ILYODFUR_038424 [Ilyodon furcidens]|uniref:Uncharacterized protein n=1 Tax=Ilyodon furcidens TaxID=33524 RepID=A0ABV0SSP0_9TELE
MMLGDDVSERFLTQWPSYFKEKVMAESKSLPSSPCVEELRASFDPELTDDYGWDSDVAALLLLLHLLPPTSRGHKKTAKISSTQAATHLLRFVKVCTIRTFCNLQFLVCML